jgi:hypothetical protein
MMKVIGEREEPCTGCGRDVVYVRVDRPQPRRPTRARSGPPTLRHAGRETMSDLIDDECNWPNPSTGPSADYGDG